MNTVTTPLKSESAELTNHSEVGKIHSVFCKKAVDAFCDDVQVSKYWEILNFLGKPVVQKANEEHERFVSIISSQGAAVLYFPYDDTVNMDSIYCRDASIFTNMGVIVCNMGKAERYNEPVAQQKIFEATGIPVLGSIVFPGTVEGGDVAWINEYTLAVGLTYRTNRNGIRQLTELLSPMNVEVITVPLPHYKGPSDVFHLMSILSPVDKNLAVVYSPLMPIEFRNFLLTSGYELIEVPEEEFNSMGCNVLALAPRVCLMVDKNPITKAALEKAGCIVYVYEGDDISVKGGGGPTCLTRPVRRYR